MNTGSDHHAVTRRPASAGIVLLGGALVLTMVAALPLVLALVTPETPDGGLTIDATGDLTAAALHSLTLGLRSERLLADRSHSLSPVRAADGDGACPPLSRVRRLEELEADALATPTPSGGAAGSGASLHPLLL